MDSGTFNLVWGYQSGYSLTTGGSNVFLGNKSGYRQTTNSNLLIIDNQQRADIATEATNSILYGVMAETKAGQSLRVNAGLYIDERAAANADVAGYGQLWCKDNAGTTELWFTDDSGTDTKIV